MSWDDFLKHFDGIDVCIIPSNLGDIKLDVIEEYSVCGSIVGCIIGIKLFSTIIYFLINILVGTIKYWLCCCGLYHLWCAKSTKVQAAALDV